jgi:hypothetical protein
VIGKPSPKKPSIPPKFMRYFLSIDLIFLTYIGSHTNRFTQTARINTQLRITHCIYGYLHLYATGLLVLPCGPSGVIQQGSLDGV